MATKRNVVAIVDDDAGMRTALQNLLSAFGYCTQLCASAAEFVRAAITTEASSAANPERRKMLRISGKAVLSRKRFYLLLGRGEGAPIAMRGRSCCAVIFLLLLPAQSRAETACVDFRAVGALVREHHSIFRRRGAHRAAILGRHSGYRLVPVSDHYCHCRTRSRRDGALDHGLETHQYHGRRRHPVKFCAHSAHRRPPRGKTGRARTANSHSRCAQS